MAAEDGHKLLLKADDKIIDTFFSSYTDAEGVAERLMTKCLKVEILEQNTGQVIKRLAKSSV
jgi:hypothetical protein